MRWDYGPDQTGQGVTLRAFRATTPELSGDFITQSVGSGNTLTLRFMVGGAPPTLVEAGVSDGRAVENWHRDGSVVSFDIPSNADPIAPRWAWRGSLTGAGLVGVLSLPTPAGTASAPTTVVVEFVPASDR